MLGTNIETLSTLVKYTMSIETAKTIVDRFTEMSSDGGLLSYMDCVLFDSALEVLGQYKDYYGLSDEEWELEQKTRQDGEKAFGNVKVVDITDTWREILD